MNDMKNKISLMRKRKAEESLAKAIPDTPLGELFREAISRYGARCLWNCDPEPSIEGMKVVVEHLKKYGDLRAWYLAEKIRDEIDNAARSPSI